MTTVSMLLGDVTSGYPVKNSLRFRSSASAYLSRTPASATNQTVWTFSAWLKRGTLGANETIFEAYTNGSNSSSINFSSSDAIQISNYVSGSLVTNKITSAVYRDPSAWYHIVVASNGATSLNLYVNGAQVTSFGTNVGPTSGNWFFNGANAHRIATESSGGSATQLFDGYLAEFNWIDGQSLTASSFGTYDTNGVWQPIKYSGSYGTNGFYLNFGNTTSTTTLGYDTSGNGNNWTPNNISLTAGSTYDSMTDSPTVTSASVANYATLNPLGITSSSSTGTANGNLQYASTGNSTGQQTRLATMGFTTGKWYYEWINSSGSGGQDPMGGWANNSFNLYSGNPDGDSNCWGFQFNTGTNVTKKNGATATQIFTAPTNGDVMMVAVDLGAGKIWIGKNGVWSESGVPSTGTNAQFTNLTGSIYYPYVRGAGGSGATSTLNVNYGQQPFTYTPPTGFNALNTYNLPTPTIANGAQYMAATTYTGNGGTQTITNGGNNTIGTTFQPDFVWVKSRVNPASGYYNTLQDSVRGFTSGSANVLYSNTTDAEVTNNSTVGGGVSAFNSNGFSLANGSGGQSFLNANTYTYVGWQWKAGGSGGSSNTNGSITSTVSANTTAGFSVVTYTEPAAGTSYTVGHGLGTTPAMIILKERNVAGDNWVVWQNYWTAPTTHGLYLNATNAQFSTGSNWLNSTNSTVFGILPGQITAGGYNIVAYCWAAVAGYSAFGSYTGNGSTDGPFVYTGFRPRWIMVKRTDTSGYGWKMLDTSRSTYNVSGADLFANLSDAESTGNTDFDLLSNGFKARATYNDINASGGTYIYAAFAENPFNSSRAR
jgi:Concanavalin A-like lectin/glucanases superfamily